MYFKDRLYTSQNLLHKHVQCERCKNDTKHKLTAPLILINTGGRRLAVMVLMEAGNRKATTQAF
jgi:hypothetical protein